MAGYGPDVTMFTRIQVVGTDGEIEISFPDGNVTCSGRIGFILGVWLPLVFYSTNLKVHIKALHVMH